MLRLNKQTGLLFFGLPSIKLFYEFAPSHLFPLRPRAAAYHTLNESYVVHHGKIDRRWQRWVRSGRDALKFRCPLYPRKQTFLGAVAMFGLGHKQTSAASLDHLVGTGEE